MSVLCCLAVSEPGSLPARDELYKDWSYKPCVKIVTELWHVGDPQENHSHMYSVVTVHVWGGGRDVRSRCKELACGKLAFGLLRAGLDFLCGEGRTS